METKSSIACVFEKEKYYNLKLNNGTVIINFFVHEIIGDWLLGSSGDYRVNKIRTINKGQEIFAKGEAINKNVVKECEESPYKEIAEG
ncbi:MAG: hypothetical protein U0W65_17530 [Bacteroidia bacterium]